MANHYPENTSTSRRLNVTTCAENFAAALELPGAAYLLAGDRIETEALPFGPPEVLIIPAHLGEFEHISRTLHRLPSEIPAKILPFPDSMTWPLHRLRGGGDLPLGELRPCEGDGCPAGIARAGVVRVIISPRRGA